MTQQLRTRMQAAVAREEDPAQVTELLVESMTFGPSLDPERDALQKKFEQLLRVQAIHDPGQSSVLDLRHVR